MGFTLPVGGAVSLPNALLRILEKGGGKIFLESEVREIGLKNGRARNVMLDDGNVVEAKYFVASAIDAPTTMNMIGAEIFSDEVQKKLNRKVFY
jgi:phytoene dehydrogenase-like protein